MALSFKWPLFSALCAASLAIACGDDGDKGDSNTPTNDAAVAAPIDSSTATPGGNTTAQLGPQIAGKACTADSECTGKSGTCSKRLTLGAVGELAEQAIGQPLFLDNPGGYCTATCMNDSSCGEGGVCFGALPGITSGECRKRCSADGDCREGYECAKTGSGGDAGAPVLLPLPATCQPKLKPTPLPAGIVGKACTAQTETTACGAGACTGQSCTGACLTDGDCGAGARCTLIPFYGTLGVCVETCSQDSDCNRYTGESGGVGCNMNGTCGAKLFPLAAGVVGKECTDRAQCGGSAECATTLGSGNQMRPAPGGYCSLQGCMASSQCGGGTCVGSVVGSRCYKGCAGEGDCRSGYTCQDRMSIDNVASKVCAPAVPAADAGAPPAPLSDAG